MNTYNGTLLYSRLLRRRAGVSQPRSHSQTTSCDSPNSVLQPRGDLVPPWQPIARGSVTASITLCFPSQKDRQACLHTEHSSTQFAQLRPTPDRRCWPAPGRHLADQHRQSVLILQCPVAFLKAYWFDSGCKGNSCTGLLLGLGAFLLLLFLYPALFQEIFLSVFFFLRVMFFCLNRPNDIVQFANIYVFSLGSPLNLFLDFYFSYLVSIFLQWLATMLLRNAKGNNV